MPRAIIDANGVRRVRCHVCGCDFQPRNFRRHRTACIRISRAARAAAPVALQRAHTLVSDLVKVEEDPS